MHQLAQVYVEEKTSQTGKFPTFYLFYAHLKSLGYFHYESIQYLPNDDADDESENYTDDDFDESEHYDDDVGEDPAYYDKPVRDNYPRSSKRRSRSSSPPPSERVV